MSIKRKLNIELLKRLRTRFLRMKHRKHFHMKNIAVKTECGAAMCIAGHTLELAGYKRRYNPELYGEDYKWFTPNGREVNPDKLLNVAQRELGLTYEQAQYTGLGNDDKDNGLFFRFDLKTPKQTARLIQKVIDNPAVLSTD